MLTWIANNIWTILICAVLIAVVTLIIVSIVKDRKKGKFSCGCNCSHCSMSSRCYHHKH